MGRVRPLGVLVMWWRSTRFHSGGRDSRIRAGCWRAVGAIFVRIEQVRPNTCSAWAPPRPGGLVGRENAPLARRAGCFFLAAGDARRYTDRRKAVRS